MMQKRLFALLAITVLVLGGGLWMSHRQSAATDTQTANGALVPNLAAKLNEVSAIKVTGANAVVIADLKRADNGWVVAGKSDYPADISRVREFLIKLSEAKLREAKTAKPENYARLGVEDLSTADAKGAGVELIGLGTPVHLIVGISSGGGSPGTFVRRQGEAASYLVNGDLVPEKEASNWLAKTILDLPSAQIRQVTITAPDASVLRIEKTDPNAFNYSVLDLPKNAKLSGESVANLLAGVLASLTLEDVVPASEILADASAWTGVYMSYEGLVVESKLVDKNDKSFAQFAARVDDAQLDAWVVSEKAKADAARATAQAQIDAAAARPQAPTSGEGAPIVASAADQAAALPAPFDAEKSKSGKRAELQKQADEINARTANWSYVIPSWKAINFKKRLADLLESKEAAGDKLPAAS